MTDNENNLIDLQRHTATLDNRLTTLETNFAVFVQEMKDFKDEMREKDNQRQKENAEIKQSIKEIYQTTDVKIGKIESKIDSMGNHIRNLAITAMVGIIAAGAGIAAMVISALTKS